MLSFLLFPVDRPEFFDAVVLEDESRPRDPGQASQSRFQLDLGRVQDARHVLYTTCTRSGSPASGRDEYIGTLVNAYLRAGGEAVGVKAGQAYVDVGTLNGYRAAMSLLGRPLRRRRG